MSDAPVPLTPNAQILDEASAWFVEFSEGEVAPDAREAFSAWLKASPEHVRAYLAVSATFDDLGVLEKSRKGTAEGLVYQALREGNVVDLRDRVVSAGDLRSTVSATDVASPGGRAPAGPEDTRAAAQRPWRARQSNLLLSRQPHPMDRDVTAGSAEDFEYLSGKKIEKRSWRARDGLATATSAPSRWIAPRGVLAASVVASIVGLGATALWLSSQRGVYTTGTGEQRIVNLADGSTLELNAESVVRVRLTDRERDVDLEKGQALFNVAKDSRRPFIVKSDGTTVRAVGTQFDVDRETSATVVTVLEGRVAVAQESEAAAVGTLFPTDASPLFVSAGEQVILTAQAASRPAHADLAAATAWRKGKLIFSSTPLTAVIAEYNRYHEKRLVLADAALADFRISGVFSAADSTSLIAFLRAQSNIAVEEQGSRILLRAR
jgi:transmembrane sensor